jgi:hypothetical protein
MRRILSGTILIMLSMLLSAQPYQTVLEEVTDWNGWSALLVSNGLISTATVPAIGARVMEYNLGEYPSIYRNESLNGDTHTPSEWGWYNFGGFKNWPAPQNDPGRWGWPPPPTLDYGNYSYEILANTSDSVKIQVTSPVEQFKTPGLQFRRIMTIYKNSSRVRMEQFLLNHATEVQDWSIWDITQSIGHHSGQNDYANFWVYFPLNPDSKFGSDGVDWSGNFGGDPNVLTYGEVAPGIFGLQNGREEKKVFADIVTGWVCFADLGSEVVFAKTFTVVEGASYPDNGGVAQVYTTSSGDYLEVEVTGPIEDIPADGGQIELTINWWAAKVKGPIIALNNVGAVSQRISMLNNVISGNYGVFHVGTARLVYLDSDDAVLSRGDSVDVSPLQNLAFSQAVSLPENTASVELRVYDETGVEIGVLDSSSVEDLTSIAPDVATQISAFTLNQNYPNPFNASTAISFQIDRRMPVKLSIYDLAGRARAILADRIYDQGSHRVIWNAANFQSGLYLIRLESDGLRIVRKCMLLK